MPPVDDSEFASFVDGLSAAYRRIGGGKLALESSQLRSLVREHKAAAFRFVELHCETAQSSPGYLQPALIVATAYYVEFGDGALIGMVQERAGELGPLAAEEIDKIGVDLPAGDPQPRTEQLIAAPEPDEPARPAGSAFDAEPDPATVFEQLVDGHLGLGELSAWVSSVLSYYQRPDFAQIDPQDGVKDLSWHYWYADQADLAMIVRQVARIADDLEQAEPARAALYAHAIYLTCPLFSREEIAGKFAARAGFVLSATGNRAV